MIKKALMPPKFFVADFETTVYEGQDKTEVWAAALVDLSDPDEPESVQVFNNINTFFATLLMYMKIFDLVVYFHNLKFDGTFILNYLYKSNYWKPYTYLIPEGQHFESNIFRMPNRRFVYSISDKGQWYTVRIKDRGHYCEFRDSLKLLPFSVKQIGKGFNTKHRKLEMEYEGFRQPYGLITDEEKAYIANDVLVVKEAIEFMFSQGHDKLTIGACCLAEYKSYYTKKEWNEKFPDLYEIFSNSKYGADDEKVGDWIRKSYKGGWCFCNPKYAGLEIKHIGVTADVNSLYPSMMHSASGNRYPVGRPHYFTPEELEEIKADPNKYYFIRVRTRFYLKPNHLPTIQIKGSPLYYGREWLTTSDIKVVEERYNDNGEWILKQDLRRKYPFREYSAKLRTLECKKETKYYRQYTREGKVREAIPELTLTMTDWELLQRHYDLEDTTVVEGFWFDTEIGLFDAYIDKYAEMKMTSKGAMRQLAKLFLNSLYGKAAVNPLNSCKMEFLDDDDVLKSYIVDDDDKKTWSIALGSAITSYARNFTITAAQKNYDVFCYADTDSIHCVCSPDELVGAPEDPVKFNHWKYETCWDFAKFVRAKTYVEHVTHEDREEVEHPYYNMKCAGMSEHVKQLFLWSVEQNISDEDKAKLDADEVEFIGTKRTFEEFKEGLEIPGMLKAQQIPGGTLLVKGNYKMHPVWAL